MSENNNTELQNIMQIILAAGDAQNQSKEAMDLIAQGKDEEAREKLSQARENINAAHAVHAGFLTHVMDVEVNVLLVHALDHLTMAELLQTMADKTLNIVERRLS